VKGKSRGREEGRGMESEKLIVKSERRIKRYGRR
jgi:hypothetical protein